MAGRVPHGDYYANEQKERSTKLRSDGIKLIIIGFVAMAILLVVNYMMPNVRITGIAFLGIPPMVIGIALLIKSGMK
jgi:hypothetical protein